MKTRSKAREIALKALYRLDMADGGADDTLKELFLEPSLKEPARQYSETLVHGIMANVAAITSVIEESSDNWTIDRMSVIDRSILKLAVYELLYQDIPYKVVIDEAVELAKKFGGETSSSFINGILDRIANNTVLKKAAAAIL